MADIFVVALLLLAFLPVSALLSRGALAYLLSPVMSAFAALIAGLVHVLVDVSVLVIWAALVSLQIPPLIHKASRVRMLESLKIEKSDFSDFASLVSAGALGLVALITTPAPLAWDARSIWFHHAAWLNGPAIYFREAQFLPVGSWPDYPILGPSLMALSFQATGGDSNFWLASRVVGVLVLLIASWTVAALVARWNPKLHFGFVAAVTLAFGLAFTVLADGYYNAGYMDALQAVSVVALFASVLSLPTQVRVTGLIVPGVLFVVAANIKQEGFWFAFGALLLGLAYQVLKRNYIALGLIVVAGLTRIGWGAFQEHLKMPDNGHTAEVIERLPLLLVGEHEVLGALGLIWTSWGQPRSSGYLLIAILASSVLLVLWGKQVNWQARAVIPALLLAAPAGVLLVAILTYALGQSGGLEWWLGTSYTRITSTFEALALFSVAFAAIALGPQWKPKVIAQAKPESKKSKKKKSRS
jgi:hypothetical protein